MVPVLGFALHAVGVMSLFFHCPERSGIKKSATLATPFSTFAIRFFPALK
jgi:hypothetical protein